MQKNIKVNLEEMESRLNYWLDKVEICYRQEVENSMNNFRKEIGIKVDKE